MPPPPPHTMTPPQPSEMVPQSRPATQVVAGVQAIAPHWFGPPAPPSAGEPPQNTPASHVPHRSTPPQPSGALPHCKPCPLQVSGWHPHEAEPFAFVTHTVPALHIPQ